ncbi:MAG: sigma factor-like helix-turn-helix DNA-binding protein [Patescibacteria group bacterium UBA2103]
MTSKVQLAHDPKKVVRQLLSGLPERSKEVLTLRFGLGKSTKQATLEAIGQEYGITRERVRQIENHSLDAIRKGEEIKKQEAVFTELEGVIRDMGCIVSENDLLDAVGSTASIQNHVHFLLVLGEFFVQSKETPEFKARWSVDENVAGTIEGALKTLYKAIPDEEILSEADLIDRFLENLQDLNEEYKKEEMLRRWLSMFKNLDRNPLGEWGRVSSSSIRAKGIRDFAYLAMKRHGSPMHFSEVADSIAELFGKRAHVATCHNELIKDKRFVLVGRGLYALKEWGYKTGVVRDVIKELIEKEGPLTREEIIDRVKKERYVKDNTILVNLNDRKVFKRNSDNTYSLV